VWATAPPSPTFKLKLRDADGLRRAMLYAGLSPSDASTAPPSLQPLDLPPSLLVNALYPELAAAATSNHNAEASDALEALAAQLAPLLGVCVLRGTRPAHVAGASFSLKSRAPLAAKPEAPPPSADAVATTATTNPWASLGSVPMTVHAGEPELIDEDDLLEEEDRKKKEADMDCGTSNGGKRKACKNCSCGLREMLDAEEEGSGHAPASSEEPKSACGNCGKGDAFRCEGCPHRGKPAFEPGDELKLAESMMKSDAPTQPVVASEPKKVGGTGSVVQLSLVDDMDF
jgi:hypothetical protein